MGRSSSCVRSGIRILVAVLSVGALAVPAAAQITSATVSGTITDETGGILPGVDIAAKNIDTGLSRTFVSTAEGSYTIAGLPPGKYEVRANLQGFGSTVETIQLTVGEQAGLNLVLKVGTAQESITVTGTAGTLVDTQSSALSALVLEKTIEELPLNGRNYIGLATLQPGIINFTEKGSSSSTRGTQLNINGMGGRSNSFLIDGANMRGYAGVATVTAADSTLGVDTIREFRVVTNAFSADYGRAMGGVISIATKSGSNALHGSAFEFFRDSTFDSPNYFDPVDASGDKQAPPFTRHQFGGSFGGPIKRNRIFFGGYERLQEDLGQTLITTVPTAAARAGTVNPSVTPYLDLYPLPNDADLGGGIGRYVYAYNRPTRENFGQGRVDLQLSEHHALFVRHTIDKSHQLVAAGLPQFTTDSTASNQFFTAEEKWVMTPALLNTARFSHSILEFEQLPTNTLSNPLSFFPEAPFMGAIGVSGLTGLGNDSTSPSTNNVTYSTYSDDLTYTKGDHLLKVGVLVEHAFTSKLTATNSRGSYSFASLATFLAGNSRAVRRRAAGRQPRARAAEHPVWRLWPGRFQGELEVHPESRPALRDLHDPGRQERPRRLSARPPHLLGHRRRAAVREPVAAEHRTAPRVRLGCHRRRPHVGARRHRRLLRHRRHLQQRVRDLVVHAAVRAAGHAHQPDLPDTRVPAERDDQRRAVAADARPRHQATACPDLQRQPAARSPARPGRDDRVCRLARLQPGHGDRRQSDGAGDAGRRLAVLSRERRAAEPGVDVDRPAHVRRPLHLQLDADLAAEALLERLPGAGVLHPEQHEGQHPGAAGCRSDQLVGYATNPYDRNADWAPAAFDIRHVFSANATWEIPGYRHNPLLSGWQVNSIVSMRSGLPFSPSIATSNWSRSGNTSGEDRPNLCNPGTDPSSLINGDPNHWFDTSAFCLQPAGTLGNTPRDFLRGPGFANVDLSFVKNQTLYGSSKLQFRVEIFNLFNRANFGTPIRTVFAGATQNDPVLPTAGQITRTTNTSRQLQLSVKVTF